jgi:tetratricopeptide (TPR) repeat protein
MRPQIPPFLAILVLLAAACASTPDLEDPSPGYEEAIRLYDAGDLDGALAEARTAAAEDPEAIRPRWLMATILEKRGDWVGAVTALQETLRAHPNFLAGANRMGEILVRSGRPAEAEECFRACVDLDGKWIPGLVNLGALLVDTGRAEEAVPVLSGAVEAAPDHGTAHLVLANAHLALDRPDEARTEVEKALACQDLSEAARAQAKEFLDALTAGPSGRP